MARKPSPRSEVAAQTPYLEGVAKNLADKLYGPGGPPRGTKFADLEELAVQLGRVISQELMNRALERQASGTEGEGDLCPSCHGPGVLADPEPRVITTRVGEAEWSEPHRFCDRCRRSFFPQSQSLGIDRSGQSPAVLAKVIYAGTMCGSFASASEALWELAEVAVPTKQVERRTQGIGTERCVERDAAAAAYLALPLVERKGTPAGVASPAVAVVEMDGGRLQIFDRSKASDTTVSRKAKGTHWREDKVGLLASMASECRDADPCPTLPKHFLDKSKIVQLVKEIKAKADANVAEAPSSDIAVSPSDIGVSPAEYEPPELVTRSVVATKHDAHRFGELLAAAAWQRGFYGSSRRAFVGDGSSANWGVWERHFSNFTPIVDFIHALTYVYQGTMADGSFAEGWSRFATGLASLWSGDVEAVIALLERQQSALGEPEQSDGPTSPRAKLAEAVGYFRNQKGRMRYAEYRTAGLPITSAHVESTIKQMNRRVKGTEKFWSEPGSEAILQLRADALSETQPLDEFWTRRAGQATGERRQTERNPEKTLSA